MCTSGSHDARAPACQVRTGTAGANDGKINAGVRPLGTSGAIDWCVTGTSTFAKDSVVFSQCYTSAQSVFVRGPHNNAWAGSVSYSSDAGTSYLPMMLASDGKLANPLVVDKDTNGGAMASARCLGGLHMQVYFLRGTTHEVMLRLDV